MELLLNKKQIPDNFVLKLNASYVRHNTACHLS